MEAYESWVRTEMETAQAKIDDLSRALQVYLAWLECQSDSVSMKPLRVHVRPSVVASSSEQPRHRVSKNDAIFSAFDAAGATGLSQEDVQRVARESGIDSRPDSLRAFCWNAKKNGRLISLAPGRYAIAPKDRSAVDISSRGETADPARVDHNQHNEGDAGGGI